MRHNRKKHVFTIAFAFLWAFSTLTCAQTTQKTIPTKNLRSMARAYMAFAKYDKAHILAEQALDQAKRQKADTGELALCLIDLGTVCSYEGLLAKAQENFEQGSRLQKQALFDEHPYVAHTLRMLSDVYRRAGNLTKAESVLSEAFGIMLKNCDLQSKEMAPFIAEAAHLQFAKGEFDKAQSNYVAAIDLYESTYGSKHLVTANLQENFAKLLIAQHDYDRADELLSEAIAVKSQIFGRYHVSLVDSWLEKASLYRMQGQTERSEYYLAKSTATAAESRDVVTIARIYQKVNLIRSGGLLASANM